MLSKYLLSYCITLIKDKKYDVAVQQVLKYDVPANPAMFDMYIRLTREILHNGNADWISSLRKMLFKLVYGATLSLQPGVPEEFSVFLMITHLKSMRNECSKSKELQYFAAKQSVSLLRYIKEIQPDRAFYEAGQSAKVKTD